VGNGKKRSKVTASVYETQSQHFTSDLVACATDRLGGSTLLLGRCVEYQTFPYRFDCLCHAAIVPFQQNAMQSVELPGSQGSSLPLASGTMYANNLMFVTL
jgi:hypothetical protein